MSLFIFILIFLVVFLGISYIIVKFLSMKQLKKLKGGYDKNDDKGRGPEGFFKQRGTDGFNIPKSGDERLVQHERRSFLQSKSYSDIAGNCSIPSTEQGRISEDKQGTGQVQQVERRGNPKWKIRKQQRLQKEQEKKEQEQIGSL